MSQGEIMDTTGLDDVEVIQEVGYVWLVNGWLNNHVCKILYNNP
jgi:hypothetical protein